jgi:hypothetical protein
MVVCNLDLVRVPLPPFEANTILVVNPNAVLAIPIAPETLKPVAGRHSQIPQRSRRIEHLQFLKSGFPQVRRDAATPFFGPKPLRVGVWEGFDHPRI